MKTLAKEIKFKTKKKYDFRDITEKIEEMVAASKVKNGIVNVQSLHTSSAVYVNENEPLLLKDLQENWRTLFSPTQRYHHDNMHIRTVNVCKDECKNGHSHCNAVVLGTSVSLNIVKGKIKLGKWQRMFFVELDRSRDRGVSVMIVGE